MKVNMKMAGDDLYENRLFYYLTKELGVELKEFRKLRGNVFYVGLKDKKFILKGFDNLRKLKIQEAFTTSLRKSGFMQSYRFYHLNEKSLYFQNMFFGCIEYIVPHRESFHYARAIDRKEGMDLLEIFHEYTGKLTASYKSLLPKANLLQKWQDRRNEFLSNLPKIHFHLGREITDYLIYWADSSLSGMMSQTKQMDDEALIILHGDVAHHNFLRSNEGKLYLIDYDLISIGPAMNDHLQYANRILPFLNWRLDLLEEEAGFKEWFKNEAFINGLLYPSDLLREWNRLLRGKQGISPHRLSAILEMTGSQFQERKQFSEKIISMLK